MKIISRKTLWQGEFIKTELISYEDRQGVLRHWEAVSRTDCDGVVIIVPVTTQNELILIRQYRPALDRYVIEFPAGLIDKGEDVAGAARRELLEETGHATDSLTELAAGAVSTGINSELWNVMLALNAVPASEEDRNNHLPDENEDIEIIKVDIDKLAEKLDLLRQEGSVIDLRIFGLVELARDKIRRNP